MTVPSPGGRAPAGGRRAAVAIAIGIAAAAIAWLAAARPGFGTPDFAYWWLGARALLAGQNPYAVVAAESGSPLYYPLPALLATAPLALLPLRVAAPLFTGIAAAVLAYACTRESWDRLPLFLSASFLHAALMGQWSPLLTAALLLPGLGVVGAVKPNIGLAILAYRPSVREGLAIAAVMLLSLLVMPSWPMEWLRATRQSVMHFAPWHVPGGFLVILAFLRWRRPEARLLGVMGLVPSSPIVYEALPLFVIPEGRRQMYAAVILSDIAFLFSNLGGRRYGAEFVSVSGPAVVYCLYLPALLLVLSRPNEGRLPDWIERLLPRRPRGAERRP